MAVSPVEICPSCGRNPIEDEQTGWCLDCTNDHSVQSYWDKEAPAIEARRDL